MAIKVVRRMGDKGQVTIPKEVRDLMNIHEGDMVEFEIVAVHVPRRGRKAPTTPALSPHPNPAASEAAA